MDILIGVCLAVLGAVFGSFACCQAWRVHDKDKSKWSKCEHCGRNLRWYDNIPVFSWILLRGKCRYCHKKIGCAEILSEVMMAVIFVVAGFMLKMNLALFPLFAIFAILIWILLVYDAKWGELPVWIMILSIAVAAIYKLVEYFGFGVKVDIFSLLASVGILAGIYYFLYLFSHEKLVGGGDWILCLSIAIMLGRWDLGLLELFLSNFLAVIVMLPNRIKNRKQPFAFGPFLVIAFFVVFFLKDVIAKFVLMV